MDDTISASDFTSAEASISSEPVAASEAPIESSAAVDTTAQPEGATTQPADATTDAAPPSTEPVKAGPIPFDVHKTALENARQKAVAEWEQQYGWAKQVSPQEFQQVAEMARRASADPIGYLQDFIKELQAHPQHAAQLRSLAARALSQRSQQAAAEQEPQPDLPIQLEDGRVVHLYSAEQQAKREAFLQQQWMRAVEQKIQPFQQTHEQLQAEREAERMRAADTQFATTVTADVKTWPGVNDEAMKAMAAVIANDPRLPAKPTYADLDAATNRAYRQVVLPTLHTASRQAVLNDINRQAAASTVNPARTTTRAPKSIDEMSIAEALQHVAAQGA